MWLPATEGLVKALNGVHEVGQFVEDLGAGMIIEVDQFRVAQLAAETDPDSDPLRRGVRKVR